MLGRKTMEVEIFREALAKSKSKKTELAALVAAEGRFPMKSVADALEVARSHLHEKVRRLAKPRGSYRKPDDGDLLPLIRRLVDERPTYGYRRITALANRELVKTGKPMANHKRIFRIMRQNGMLLARHTGRRKGRLHDGKVVVMRSNLRWCSDGFEISCWNGDHKLLWTKKVPDETPSGAGATNAARFSWLGADTTADFDAGLLGAAHTMSAVSSDAARICPGLRTAEKRCGTSCGENSFRITLLDRTH